MIGALRGLLLGGVLLAVLTLAQAQNKTVYKVRLPDGRIEFTDNPPSDAKVLDKIEAKPNLTLPRPPAPTPPSTPGAAAPAQVRSLDAATKEVEAAEQALDEAKRAREAGREPHDDEIRGIKGGGARTLPTYEARQKALEDAVAAAEERVKRAYDARNAVR